MKSIKILIAFLAVILTCGNALALDSWQGQVVGVSDGDTITVMHNGKGERVRLWGVDCPEKTQAYGQRAKQFTSYKTFKKTVTVEVHDIDRYGRTVGHVFIDGQSLNESLIRVGMAWVYTDYCAGMPCSEWSKQEARARASKTGLWADAHPIAPWDFRHPRKSGPNMNNKVAIIESSAGSYHGNNKSLVFHAPRCKYYDCKSCTAKFSNRNAAIKAGYEPCGLCNP